jgi:hypothetical protein
MKIFDRYTNNKILEHELPNQLDLGRFFIDDDHSIKEVTYSYFSTKKVIRQELLLEKNKSLKEFFVDIFEQVKKSDNNNFNVIPLIQRIKSKLTLNEFEKLLSEKIFHLEEIIRSPHYLLKREIEKVHVSRAKRIPFKSYQYLASHTEDWLHKSIISLKPLRILNEDLELNYNIYENHLTVTFIERCLIYLNSRLKEVQDIKSFLSEYEKLLKNRDDEKGWYEKINRNLSLIGQVYEDEYYNGKEKDKSILTETEGILNNINKRLLQLRKSKLFEEVNKRFSHSIVLRNTNVLVNHKHYKYVKILWLELNKVSPEISEKEQVKFEQKVIQGLRAFGKSLIAYTLTHCLDYDLKGNYKYFEASHLQLSNILFNETDEGVFELQIGDKKIRIVVIGNYPQYENILEILKSNNTYIFYFDENKTVPNERFIKINPFDPDSIERVGKLIRKYLLRIYINNIKRTYKFKQLLRDFVKYIPTDFIEFDISSYSYWFHSYPAIKLPTQNVISKIEADLNFKSRNKSDQSNIINFLNELLTEIENNANKLKDELHCFKCGERLVYFKVKKLNYLQCSNSACRCLIDFTDLTNVTMRIYDKKYSDLHTQDFGMDYLKFDFDEL